MDHKLFGKKLKELRDANSMSQLDLAKLLEVGIKQVQRYEAGEVLPPHDSINSLIKHFKYDFLSLIYDINNIKHIDKYTINYDSLLDLIIKRENSIEVFESKAFKAQNDLLEEKEARRQETEARLNKSDTEKNKLMDLLELSLKRLENLSISTLSHLEAYTHHSAELESGGDQKKRKRILEELNKKAGDFRTVLVKGGKTESVSK